MSFEIVANYQKHGYSLPSQTSNDAVSDTSSNLLTYPRDVKRDDIWTNRTSLVTLSSGNDDTFSTTPIPIGFDWGWNGTTYNQWYLNTNGMMLFVLGVSSGTINPSSNITGICAHNGDLWFQPSLANTDQGINLGIPTWSPTPGDLYQYTDISLSTLLNTYNIQSDNYNGYLRLKPRSIISWYHNPTIQMFGYTNTSGTYVQQSLYSPSNLSLYADSPGSGYNSNPLGEFFTFPLKTYNDGVVTNIPFSSISTIRVRYIGDSKPTGAQHGVWDYSTSWTENSVIHYYYSTVVYCSFFSTQNTDASYRISLYKAGATQIFSISLVSDSSRSTGGLQSGPWPFSATNGSLTTSIDWREQSWYSENNGTTWFRYAPGGTKVYSTVTQMAPPQSWTSSYGRLGPNLAKLDPFYNSSTFYSNTPITIIQNAPWFDSTHFVLGIGVVNTMMRMIVGNAPINDVDQRVQDKLNQSYSTGGKGSSTFSYKDFTKDGVFDLSDSIDLTRIINGLQPNDSDSFDTYQRFLTLLVNDAKDDANAVGINTTVMNGYIAGSYLVATKNSWSYAWDNKLILPGVKAVPPTKVNLSTAMYDNLGAIAKNTIVPLDGAYIAVQKGAIYNVWNS